MTCEEFIKIYWSQYISIEKEFTSTLYYLPIDVINENSYSQAYAKLMLEIGSEIDIIFKDYCLTIDPSFRKNYSTIVRYKNCISNMVPDFIQQIVYVKNCNINLQPWIEWNGSLDAPLWWKAHNKIKHERTTKVKIGNSELESYKFASQKYTLLSLAGLYQTMTYYYHKLASDVGKKVLIPMPGSRLFELRGGMWNNVSFFSDFALYVNDDNILTWETSDIYY